MRTSHLFRTVGVIAGLAGTASAGEPYSLTWAPEDSGFHWSSSGNWTGASGQHPDDDFDQAIFQTAAANPEVTGDIDGNHGDGLGQLVFQTPGWTVQDMGGYTMFLNSIDWYGYNALFSRGSGVNTIATKVEFRTASQNIYTSTGNTLAFTGGFTGSYGPVISSENPTSADTGVVRLDVASPVSGAFYLRQGTVHVRANGALGQATSLNIGGDEWVANGANARLLTDAGSVTVSQNLTVRSYTEHEVNATVGGHQTAGSSSFTGTLTLNRSASLTSANTDGNAVAFNNTISGVGGITKIGAGTVRLNHANTYQGDTVVQEGRLLLGASSALPSSTAVSLANAAGAALDLNGYSQTIASLTGGGGAGGGVALGTASLTVGSGDFSGVISGGGSLRKTGSGMLALGGQNTYQGDTVVQAGKLLLGASGALPSSTAVSLANAAGAGLDLNGYNQTIASLTGGGGAGGGVALGTASLTVGSGDFSGVISGGGSLRKTGSGMLALSGQNTYQGDTVVQAGKLLLGASGALPSSTAVSLANAAGVVLDLDGYNQTIATLTGGGGSGGVVVLGTASLTVGRGDFSGIISGNGSLRKTGSEVLWLRGRNTYEGDTYLEGGTVFLTGEQLGKGTWHVASGGVLAGGAALGGSIAAAAGSVVAPGFSIGTLTCQGNALLEGELRVEVDPKGPGRCDIFSVGKELDLGSATLVLQYPIVAPLDDDAYVFASYDSLIGSAFERVVNLPKGYHVDYDYRGLHQIAIVVPEPAESAAALLATAGLAVWICRRGRNTPACSNPVPGPAFPPQ